MSYERFDIKTYSNEFIYLGDFSGTDPSAFTGYQEVAARLDALILTTTSPTDIPLELGVVFSSTYTPYGQIVVPALAGTVGVPAVDAVVLLAPPSIGAFIAAAKNFFYVRCVTPLATGDLLLGVSFGGTF